MAENKTTSSSGMEIPDHAIDSIARVLLPQIQRFFESEEGQRALAEWRAQRERENRDNGKT